MAEPRCRAAGLGGIGLWRECADGGGGGPPGVRDHGGRDHGGPRREGPRSSSEGRTGAQGAGVGPRPRAAGRVNSRAPRISPPPPFAHPGLRPDAHPASGLRPGCASGIPGIQLRTPNQSRSAACGSRTSRRSVVPLVFRSVQFANFNCCLCVTSALLLSVVSANSKLSS